MLFYRYLVSDAAGAIRNGFVNVFGADCTLIMCYYHVKANLITRTKHLPEDAKKELFGDIESLYFCWSTDMFDKASLLFQNKWEPRQPELVKYMRGQWLSTHKNWFKGFGRIPSTDNALESFNGRIKGRVSYHLRMPLNEYLGKLAGAVSKWSTKADLKKLTIDLSLWTKAVQWATADVKTKKKDVPGCGTEHLIPAKMRPYPRADKIFRAQSWVSWNHFQERASVLYSLFLPLDGWEMGTCTCRYYLSHFMCKHIVGLAIKNELVVAPLEASQIPIGNTRKRGRPRKVKSALQRD